MMDESRTLREKQMPVFRFKVMTLKDKTRTRKGPATNKGKQEQTIIEKNAFTNISPKL